MKIKVILILLLIGMYSAGVGIGSYRQTKAENQDEMYEYLSGAVSEYESKSLESIKSVAKDNAKILVPVLFFGFFKISPIVIAALILLKGYSAGFAITSMLRLYGIKGLLFCGANLISSILLIPALSMYGGFTAHNTIYNCQNRQLFLKKYLILAIFITATFCVDSLARGFFSSIFMKMAATMAKSV